MHRQTITALVAAVLAASASAGTLDRALLARSGQMLEYLASAGHRTVGVLPFRIKKGPGAASADAAPLGEGLAGRLENALVVVQANERSAVRVLRGCADRLPLAKRFSTRYDGAWGNAKARPDALLTGEVTVNANRRSVQVVVEVLEARANPAPRKVASFRVECDLPLLRDLGYSFLLPAGTRPDDALALARKQIAGDAKAIQPLSLDVHYDSKKQAISASNRIPSPRSGQKVALYLTRLSAEPTTLGAVLRIDGRSTFAEEDGEPADCKKWLLHGKRKGVRQGYLGFYHKSEKGDLTPKAFKTKPGWIELDVYAPVKGPARDEKRMGTRAMATARARTLKELQARLARANHLKPAIGFTARGGGLSLLEIEPSLAATSDKTAWQHLGGITLRVTGEK